MLPDFCMQIRPGTAPARFEELESLVLKARYPNPPTANQECQSTNAIQSNISMHHYGCVALYEASILQKGRSWINESTKENSNRISPVRDWRPTHQNWHFCQVQSHVTQKQGQI